MKNTSILLLFFLFFQTNTFSQGYLHRNGTTIVDGNNKEIILHGIGIGGWMLQEGYMFGHNGNAYTQHGLKSKLAALIGNTEVEKFYTNWRNNFVRQRDVDSIAAWGYNSIRVPMHYNLFRRCFAPDAQNDEGFRLIDSLVRWSTPHQVYLILDMHATPGGQGDDTGIADRDATKPYLWTSTANQDTLVQIWKNIATRYATQPIIGGYDLINETNYAPMKPTNQLLRDLFVRITNAIRSVDTNHIIFIEGNDWANNFTGLTPPWDENMVYSFHKYWNSTDKNSIQWMLDLRASTNRPLWLGETGENSNAWFTACVKLAEANKIGYANWPYKTYDRIQCPVTVKPFANWQKVLNYVNNNATLSATDCINYLKQLTDGLLLENCRVNRDEIDAWTRQPFDDTTKPYSKNVVPGIIFAANYDLGTQGNAYNDKVSQTFSQSGEAWNSGNSFRNDGVDIEVCTDISPYNLGYDVGWTDDNEWILHTVDIASAGVYDVSVRCANGTTTTGFLHLEIDNTNVSGIIAIPPTGGWQNWRDFTANGIALPSGRHKMKIVFDKAGYNINAVKWSASSSPIVIRPMSAIAINDTTVRITYSKPLATNITPNFSDFTINSSTNHPVNKAVYDVANTNSILIYSQNSIFYNEALTVNYSGSNLRSTDADIVPRTTNLFVLNSIAPRYLIPGKIEAENYSEMAGIQTESCTDAGGGIDVGYTNAGDYMKYLVYVQTAGIYDLIVRMAGYGGKISLYYDDSTNSVLIGSVVFTSTGGWQNWQDFSLSVPLTAGSHTLKAYVNVEGFNLNYMNFALNTSAIPTTKANIGFALYPNPAKDEFTIAYSGMNNVVRMNIINLAGEILYSDQFSAVSKKYSVRELQKGLYLVNLSDGDKLMTQKLVIN
ncbi:MAG: carbohydrate-binding protein [Bacteroidales bacterium]|nr:carbohydrate-binding protein [Bacteroidales bacterium]